MAGIATIATHVRLLQGPIAVNFLLSPIEAAINGDIAPLRIKISRVVLRYEDAGGLGLRLQGVRVVDQAGAEVAEAPYAAVALSGQAFFAGQLAPARIDLIQPKLLASYSDEGGLSLRSDGAFAAPDTALDATAAAPSEDGGATGEPPKRTIEIAQAIADALDSANRSDSATSYLVGFGVRDAVIVLDMNGSRSLWGLPAYSFSLTHAGSGSALTGKGSVLTASGVFDLAMHVRETGDGKLDLQLTVADLVPQDLGALFPALQGLPLPSMPVSGQTRLVLSRDGIIHALEGDVELAAINPAGDGCNQLVSVDTGALHLRYDRASGVLEVLPSAISSTLGQAVVGGRFAMTDGGGKGSRWSYELSFSDVVLGSSDEGFAPYPMSDLKARGFVELGTGLVTLDRMEARAGDTRILVAGRMSSAAGAAVEAIATGVSADFMKRAWPACLGSDARQWVRANLRRGQIDKATFKIDMGAEELARLQQGNVQVPKGLRLDAAVSDVAFGYLKDLPPIEVPAGALSLAGTRFEVSMPAAVTRLASGREIALGDGRFRIADIVPVPAIGDITFKTSGALEAALEYLNQQPYELLDKSGDPLGDLAGEHTTDFKITLPLTETVTLAQMKIRGKAQVSALTLAKNYAALPLQGGTVDLEVSETEITAKGRLLVAGVTASLTGKRPLQAGAPREPVHITATLDDSDRDQLGLAVNHMIQGDVPIEVLLNGKQSPPHVTADLTNAEFVLDTMALYKPAGQPASVDFDIVTAMDGTMTLDAFKLVGNELAIGGTVRLDRDRNLTGFAFPDFSVNVITHMSVSGQVRPDGILEVVAEGPTYDGRPFFRTLFSAGKVTDRDLPPPRATAGLDLTARFGTMIGYSDTSLSNVTLQLKRRKGKLTALDARGSLDGKAPVAVQLQKSDDGVRYIVAESKDAGRAFKLIGLYNGIEGGESSLRVNIDGRGAAEKTGVLWARRFYLLGDAIVDKVLSKSSENTSGKVGKPKREHLAFDRLRVNFSVGQAQLVLHDSYINGPAIGATLRGNVDYGRQLVKLGGTYVPLFGLNSMFGSVPVLGELLVGRNGEGLLGITFGIQGPIDKPEVIVNPISAVAPGIFRQIFEFNPEPAKINPPKTDKSNKKPASQSSSLPPMTSNDEIEPTIGDAMPAQTAVPAAGSAKVSKKKPAKKPVSASGTSDEWQAETTQ